MGILDSRAGKIGLGFLTGGPVGAGMALLSDANPKLGGLAKLASGMAGGATPMTDAGFKMPEIGSEFEGQAPSLMGDGDAMSRRMSLGAYSQGGRVPGRGSDDVPEPDPKKAAAIQRGATESGVKSPSEYWSNLKSGLGFAEGGAVPGRASVPGNSPTNDTVEIAVSPGEEVISREDVPVVHEALERRMGSSGDKDHAKLFAEALEHIGTLNIPGEHKMQMIEPILRAKHFGMKG